MKCTKKAAKSQFADSTTPGFCLKTGTSSKPPFGNTVSSTVQSSTNLHGEGERPYNSLAKSSTNISAKCKSIGVRKQSSECNTPLATTTMLSESVEAKFMRNAAVENVPLKHEPICRKSSKQDSISCLKRKLIDSTNSLTSKLRGDLRRRRRSSDSLCSELSLNSLESGMSKYYNYRASPNTLISDKFYPRLRGLTIDTSRAKSNAHVLSICAQKLRMTEFKEPRDFSCDIYWHNVAYADMRNVVKGGAEACVNRFPGMSEMARKIALTQAVRSMKHLFPNEYRFYPNSWVLPAQIDEFRQYCARKSNIDVSTNTNPTLNESSAHILGSKRHSSISSLFSSFGGSLRRDSSGKSADYYIAKPDDGAQGTGISLIRSLDELQNTNERLLVQEYIADPFLLPDHLKFDFRVYAIIKSINPLSIYIAREGMARFCTEKYSPPTPSNFENLFSHLTNYSLNKANNSYVHSKSLKDQIRGSKRLLSTVFHQMQSRGVNTRRLWHEIKMIVVKTVLAMVPELMLNYEHYFAECAGPQCFQIVGFDIIVRSDGTPILLEVNAAPSLSIEHMELPPTSFIPQFRPFGTVRESSPPPPVRSIVDEMIKVPLVHDCLLLVSNRLNGEYFSSARSDEYSHTLRPKNGVLATLHSNSNNQHGQQYRITALQQKRVSNDSVDDMGVLTRKRKAHLSEIFPGRYGDKTRQLLVLDRAVYLFMQFVSVKQTLQISLPALKAFLRKCNLMDILNGKELQKLFSHINYYFTGRSTDSNHLVGLPFHGFLQVLFHIARLKFELCDNNLAAFIRLVTFCDSTLRYYGVRSARLRRTELERFDTENSNSVEIYLLPNRIRLQHLKQQKYLINNNSNNNNNCTDAEDVNHSTQLRATRQNCASKASTIVSRLRSRSVPAARARENRP